MFEEAVGITTEMNFNYKYDVAFSFLEEDESLAIKINKLLEGRLSTFLYITKQNEVAGTDGEKTFNRVFGTEARIVVVLYRLKWGSTPWTRIEQTAIQNRAYEVGYDFVIFIVLKKSDDLPQWLPKNRIWVSLEHQGIEGAASVIESRVQEAGGEPREESLADKAQQLDRKIQAEKERKKFLNSIEGVGAAKREVAILFATLKEVSTQISGTTSNLKFDINNTDHRCDVCIPGYTLSIKWHLQFAKTLDYSALHIHLFRGAVSFKDKVALENSQKIEDEEFQFDLNQSAEFRWRQENKKLYLYTTRELAEHCITMIMQQLSDSRL